MSEQQPLSPEERLVRLESVLAHLQHDIDSLNQALTEHFRSLQAFETRFARIEHDLQSLTEDPETRDPGAERPPHY
ncbi:MAG: SlyX family protein [Planctomycetaceae bacterium]